MDARPEAGDVSVRAMETLIGFSGSLREKADLADLLQDFTERCAQLLDAVKVDVLLLTPAGEMSLIASFSAEPEVSDRPSVPPSERPSNVLPLRHANETLGAVDVFCVGQSPLDEPYRKLPQALADIAAYAIGQARVVQRATDLAGQLQQALASRIVIEQAKGVVAEQLKLDVPDAFGVLRRYARSRSVRISEVAGDVVARRLSAEDLIDGARSRKSGMNSASQSRTGYAGC